MLTTSTTLFLWIIILVTLISMIPSIIAWNRNVKGLGIIIILNIIFGHNPLIWMILFLWAIFG